MRESRERSMSSIKVYPFISDAITIQPPAAPGEEEQPRSFQEILENADRTQRAMAVDALIAAGRSGSLAPEIIQKLLGVSSTADNTAGAQTTSAAAASESTQTNSSSDAAALSCSSELDAYFTEAAEAYGVDVNLLKAIAKAESNFNPDATSSAGAMGIMQLMPSTAESLGITDAYNAYDNIMGGAKIISQNLEKYDGDLSLALAAYNAGSGNVDKYGGIPPFTETQNYVKKVMAYYEAA